MMAAVSASTTIGARPNPGAGPLSLTPGEIQASTAAATRSPPGSHQTSLLTHGSRERSSSSPGLALQARRHAAAATLIVPTTTTPAATAPTTEPAAHPNTAHPRSRASIPSEAPAWRSAISPLSVGRYQKDSSLGVASSPGSTSTMSLRAYSSNSFRLLRPSIASRTRTPSGASSPMHHPPPRRRSEQLVVEQRQPPSILPAGGRAPALVGDEVDADNRSPQHVEQRQAHPGHPQQPGLKPNEPLVVWSLGQPAGDVHQGEWKDEQPERLRGAPRGETAPDVRLGGDGTIHVARAVETGDVIARHPFHVGGAEQVGRCRSTHPMYQDAGDPRVRRAESGGFVHGEPT